MPHQRASIDTFDADDARALEVIAKRHFGAPVRRPRPAFLDDETLDVDSARLFVHRVDSNVPDFGIRHANDFAGRLTDRAEGMAAKNATVGEREYGLLAFACFRHETLVKRPS